MQFKERISRFVVVLALVCAAAIVTVPQAYAQSVERIGGQDRYETAILAVQSEWADDSTNSVVLVNGHSFADALSASGLCGELQAPLLLTEGDLVSADVLAEINRVTPFDAPAGRVILIGGTDVISDVVRAQLEAEGLTVDRIGGDDRYETSAMIAQDIYDAQIPAGGNDWTGDVWLTRGDTYPDGLSVAPYAYSVKRPVLLTRPEMLPLSVFNTMQATDVDFVAIVGGEAAVSDSIQNVFGAFGISNSRTSGSDRYATSVSLANYAHNDVYINASADYIAASSGEDFPDALAGGVTTGEAGGIMVLTQKATLSPITVRFCENHPNPAEAIVFGGAAAVSDTTLSLMNAALY